MAIESRSGPGTQTGELAAARAIVAELDSPKLKARETAQAKLEDGKIPLSIIESLLVLVYAFAMGVGIAAYFK